VTNYSVQIASHLVKQEVDAVIVACNTASAYAMDTLEDTLEIPCFGVVVPGAKAAVNATQNRVVGVLGTRGTISSGAYQKAIAALDPEVEVIGTPCPLFVPLVEEGWLTDPITREVAIRYLQPHLDAGVDTLVLGCTHYPMLKGVISSVMGDQVRLIDSAEETAIRVKEHLEEKGLIEDSTPGSDMFEVTDSPSRFAEVGQIFLEREITDVSHVTIVEGEED
jgi:glutamate racemase